MKTFSISLAIIFASLTYIGAQEEKIDAQNEVLREAGYSCTEIEKLIESGVVGAY